MRQKTQKLGMRPWKNPQGGNPKNFPYVREREIFQIPSIHMKQQHQDNRQTNNQEEDQEPSIPFNFCPPHFTSNFTRS